MTLTLTGEGVTPRTGVGTVRWYEPTIDLPPEPDSVDPEAELAAFEQARDAARSELEAERERTRERVGESEAEVFDAHIQFLDDPQVTEGVEDAVRDGRAAAHAVAEVFDEHVATFEAMEGRMAERADDLRDVRDRLLRSLIDADRIDLSDLPEGTVLLAERLTPSDTAQLDPDQVAGIVTVTGGRTSHAAIFARSLVIPAVVGVGEDLRSVDGGTRVLVDGEAGTVVVDPDEEQIVTTDDTISARHERVSTADGTEIEVAANVGGVRDLDPASEHGADGIGLFRTEFLFLDRAAPPAEDEQYEAVTAALEAFPDDRVVVRTLDVGGDKDVPYLDLPEETNPFLGARGIRLSLDAHADLFETQLRALLRAGAAAGGDLAVMFPMVATVTELDRALALVDAVAADLDAEGIEYAIPELGVMVETPAAALAADALAERVDFLSIGTNDLTQYVMAADRESETVSHLHDPLHPPVLRAIDRTVQGAEGTDTWVGMCGEMAGDPDLTELLIGLGLDEFSMSAVTVPAVKRRVSAVDTADARALAEAAMAAETAGDVRELL